MPSDPRPQRPERANSYMVSSMELRSGLEVSDVSVATLSADVLREFQRLQRVWSAGLSQAAR